MTTKHLQHPLPTALSWAGALATAEIPVLGVTARALAELATHADDVSPHDISEMVISDPLMTAKLLAQVSAGPPRARASTIASVTTAIVMVGVPPFFRAFSHLTTLKEHLKDERIAQQGVLRVIARAKQAARYARNWAVLRHDLEAETIMMAALLHDLAEMLLWCTAPQMAIEIRRRLRNKPGMRSADAQREVLNVPLAEIQLELMKRLRMPELLVVMTAPQQSRNVQVRTVALAIRLSRHSAESWDDPALPDDYSEIAALLGVSPQRVIAMVRPGRR